MKLIKIAVCCIAFVAGSTLAKAQRVITAEKGTLTAQMESPYEREHSSRLIDGRSDTKYFIPKASALWIQFEPAEKAVVNQYKITSANDMPDRDPQSWYLQASNDGITWKDLDSRKGEVFSERKETKTYKMANKVGYKYYRLNISETVGGKQIQFSEWSLENLK